MTYTVRAAPPSHYSWLVRRTGVVLTADFRAIEALDEAGVIRGMVGYEGWTANSVKMHVTIETPGALKALLGPGFEYPFIEARKKVVIGIIMGDNQRALKFVRHLGFRETYRIKDGSADGVDIVVHEMRRNECRWIRG